MTLCTVVQKVIFTGSILIVLLHCYYQKIGVGRNFFGGTRSNLLIALMRMPVTFQATKVPS